MELSAPSCREYLARAGRLPGGPVRIRELGGGVSNRVVLVESQEDRFVLKQSLDRLRVQDDWRADRSRIFREASALRDAARFLPAGAAPEVLWVDETNFTFAMTAAAPEAQNWKSQLLAGCIDPAVAARAGSLLGLWIRGSWGDGELDRRYGDQTAFDQLRIDPYYRTVAARRPDVAGRVAEMIAESAARRVSLVHGDWSPKNFLVAGDGLTVIDFEVVHYGDPTFDSAFCLNHFLLKCFRLPARVRDLVELARVFYTWVEAVLPPAALRFFEPATVRHLGCLMLARIDGKSPVEYITEDPLKEAVRRVATRIILDRIESLERCYELVAAEAARL